MIYRRDRYGRGGDHIPFLERGYPAVRFTEVKQFRHQHQNVRVENGVQFGDLPEFVDFGYVANGARECGVARGPCVGAFTTEGRDDRGAAVVERHRAALGCE